MRSTHLFAFVATIAACGLAYGQDREFAFGAGYSHLFLDGSRAEELDEQGGLRLEGRISWPITAPLNDHRPELRFGAGLGLSYFINDTDDDFDDDTFFDEESDYTQVTTIVPEIQLSLRAPIGSMYYIEPGVAGQFIVGNYLRGEQSWWDFDEEVDIWRVGGGGRLFLRGAYQHDRWSLGIEGSYSYGWLDFGHDIGGDIQTGYLGVFFAHSF